MILPILTLVSTGHYVTSCETFVCVYIYRIHCILKLCYDKQERFVVFVLYVEEGG